MKTSQDGFQQCYNAQLAVEGENQLIVAVEVSSNASDQGRMTPLVQEVESTHGRRPATVLADAGYCNEAESRQVGGARGGRLRGPGPGGPARGGGGRGEASGEGAHGGETVDAPRDGRDTRNANGCRRRRSDGSRRRWVSGRFSVRGLRKVQGEWDLVCLALNVKRMQALQAAG